MSQGSQNAQQILASINMNQSSLSQKLQRNIALAQNLDDSAHQKQSDNNDKAKTKKKIFEYRGSTDLATRSLQQHSQNQQQQQSIIQVQTCSGGKGGGPTSLNTRSKHQLAKVDDYNRNLHVGVGELAQGGGHMASFGLSEIKSPNSLQATQAHNQGAVDIQTRTSAYQLKRQQAHRQNGRHVQKEAAGIVGRQVDAPHIIVPQGPLCKNDYEQREQGTIGISVPSGNTLHLMQKRGHQTISLSPKHSPWKKTGKGSASNNYARGKPKNLFGQVKLCFVQGGAGKSTQSQNQNRPFEKGTINSTQKNFKSQPGKNAADGSKGGRASKSMEQVRHVQRQNNFVGGASQNVHKAVGQRNQQLSGNQDSKKVPSVVAQQQQQAAGRKTVLHNHGERPEMASNDGMAKQRRSGVTTRQQRSQLTNFLDQSVAQGKPSGANDRMGTITLNILTATADQFTKQVTSSANASQNFYPNQGARCKSAAAKHHPTKDHGRQLIQTKYLNFQRDAHNQNNSKKRASKSAVQENSTAAVGSGPASRANHHRVSGGARARTALAAQAQTTIVTRANSKGAVVNPFQQISSSQGRTSNSGGAHSTGQSRAFGASKNQTIEIELRRRSKSKQGGTSGILSDTPDKDKSRQRARSGGSSNKHKQQLLGVSASFSPRSRATTQFQEARSLLQENQSSGLSVNSKKQNLNQLLQNLEGRHKKSSNSKLIAGSLEYIAAPNQSSNILPGHSQVAGSGGASAVNLSSALDPAYNLSSVLLQPQNTTDPNHSVQQYMRVSNDNLRSTIAETQVGDASHQQIIYQRAAGDLLEDSKSTASKKMLANLNASLGRILKQSSMIHVATSAQQQRGGQSQSPKASRGNSRGATGANQGATKSSNVISASNTSRIDKIIQENLKKQSKKTLQKRLREQAEEQVSRKKKAELELVNERVRNTNKEKVQRRKLQQMLLMQTNHTAKAGKTSGVVLDPTADQIRDEMTRMLDELPENAIVKSQKATKHHQHVQHENLNTQNHQAQAPPQQAPLNTSQMQTSKLDKSLGGGTGSGAPKQLQARTQKIDLKFNSQQRMDGLMLRVQKQTSQNSNQVQQQQQSLSKSTAKSKAPPKNLVVNRLAVTKKDEAAKLRSKANYSQLQASNDLLAADQSNLLQDSGTVPQLAENMTSSKLGGARFKDHRKSYGLEFIDIRKEIHAELREFRPSKKSPRNNGGGASGNMKASSKALRTNLRYIAPKDGHKLVMDAMIGESTSGILSGGKNLRGSKSQRQMLAGQGANANTAIDDGQDGPANADLNVFRMMNQSSIVNNQTAILRPSQVNVASLRIKQGAGDKKANQSMTTNGGLGIILKKEKIRKFMLRKQKQKQEEDEKVKMDEIQKTLKVHQNLSKLDKFAKKTLKFIPPATSGSKGGKTGKSGAQSTLRHRNNLAVRKNMTLINDQPDSESLMPTAQNMTVTPSKTALEVSEPSFNISAKLNQRVSSKQLKKMNKLHQKDFSNAASHNLNMDTSMVQPANDGNSSSRNRHRRSSQSRRTDHYANRSINQLAPQFENSTSAKTLRAQLRKQTSSQSPPPQASGQISRVAEAPSSLNIKHSTGNRKTTTGYAVVEKTKIAKPVQMKDTMMKEHKNLKVSKKSQGTGAVNQKQQRKRGKSTNRRSAGGCTIQLSNNRQLNVRVPEAGGLTSKRSLQNQIANQMLAIGQSGIGGSSGRKIQLNHQHHNSQHKSSIQTLESQDSHARHQTSFWRHRRPSSLVSAQNLSREGAATVIQKEVRKYLKQIGFYHASPIENPSPDQEPQISLFIERRQHRYGKRSSQSRDRDNSAKRSKNSQGRSSRSGSRGMRMAASPKMQGSHPHSPDQRDRSNQWADGMQETTIIAQLSGLRQTDLFDDIVHENDNASESLISHKDPTGGAKSHQYSKSSKQRKTAPGHHHHRKDHQRTRQQSSSSERDASGKRLQNASGRKQTQSNKRSSGQKAYPAHQLVAPPREELQAQPIRQLNPVFKELNPGAGNIVSGHINRESAPSIQPHYEQQLQLEHISQKHLKSGGQSQQQVVLHEILSIQTPQSRTSKHQVINLDKQPHSPQSLSAHRISDSEFEFRQAQSSVESGSMERHTSGMNGLTNGQHDGASQSSNSLFDRNAFQQYSQKKLKVIMQNSEQSKLIKFREEVLKFQEKKERRHIKKLFKQNQFSPRTFQAKQQQIDRWVQVQKQDIERTKTTFKEEWEKTVQMIDDTQKNVDQIKSKMNLGPQHHSNSQVVSVSGASAAKPSSSALGAPNQLNNFNSQSCNSLSSHRNYQRGGQNGLGSNQLALSGLGDHQRSILIEDPPKSYRSGRQEIPQMQILPLQGGVLPENTVGGEDTGHGSMGLLSSRRSANGAQGDNLHMAQSLLQYMEQRLACHNEQKQTSLSELKSKNDQQSDINLQDVDAEIDEESELKHAMDQIEVKAPPTANAAFDHEQIQIDSSNVLTKSQQMVGISTSGVDKGHSHKPSSASNIESDMSHQPSAEFLERLERVNKQEPFISSNLSDKLIGSGEFAGFDEPLLPSALQSETDPIGMTSNQPDCLLKDVDQTPKLSDNEDNMSKTEQFERGNFKNQVMTIKDFGGIDSKRTSQQSETSNEKDFMKMLANQKHRTQVNILNNNNNNSASDPMSPTAEHLEEPSIVGKRELATHDSGTAVATTTAVATGSAAEAGAAPETSAVAAAQNIRIADMLKHQSKDIDEIIKDQSSHRSDISGAEDFKLLQEPAIISSSQTLEAGSSTVDQSGSTLIEAKVKKPSTEQPKKTLADLETIIRSGDLAERQKLIESLTDEVMKSLVDDCVRDVPSRIEKSTQEQKPSQSESQGQPNHDVYYIDQLQSEKEERKEWIELRQRHLIENDLIRIDQYVNEIVEALLQFDIDISSEEDEDLLKRITDSARERRQREQADNYHIQFLKQLTQPIQKSPNEVLQLLQTSEIGSYKHFETTQDLQKYPIIPVNLYLEIEKAREEALLARKGANMSKQTQMVWESIHIQNKSFFDAINESLMKFRPYGLTGEPMPWSNKIRRLQTKVDIGSVDTERLFQMVKQEVFRWSQAFCGALPSPVFCFPSASAARDKEEFNDELFQENREKRLTQVLSAETVEQEHHWLNYEYEEAQVKVDLSDMILEHLVDELATFLNQKSQGHSAPAERPAIGSDAGVVNNTASATNSHANAQAAGSPPRDSNAPAVEVYELMQDEPQFA